MIYRNWRNAFVVAGMLLVGGMVSGCSKPFAIQTPSGFIELNDQEPGYDYRSFNDNSVVLSVKAIKHDPKGDLSSWSKLIEKKLKNEKGYAVLDRSDVQSANGVPGKQMRFGQDMGKVPYIYMVTVFVTKDYIYLLEAGGTKEQMTADMASVEGAVRSFQTKLTSCNSSPQPTL
jgi:hypothetical protein